MDRVALVRVNVPAAALRDVGSGTTRSRAVGSAGDKGTDGAEELRVLLSALLGGGAALLPLLPPPQADRVSSAAQALSVAAVRSVGGRPVTWRG